MRLSKRKVEYLLAMKEMSYTDLADKAGTSRQNLCRLFNNAQARPKTIGKISNALGVRPEEILEEEE